MTTHLRTITSLLLASVFLFIFSACSDDDNADPCEGTDLAVTFMSSGLTITAEASGGTAPYEFSTDGTNFQTSADFDLSDGNAVTLTVRDANECEATVNVPACEVSDLTVTFIPTGFAITAEATGGTAPYEFSVDGTNFQASADFDLPDGDGVTLTVRDANACEATVDVSSDEVQSVLDPRDDRVYSVFESGDQLWLGENLRYRPGSAEGTFCFDDIEANCEEDGVLYTFAAAETACPAGWGLATEAQWQTLVDVFGGDATAGAALMAGGSSGFNAELAGIGNSSGDYISGGRTVRYWIDATTFLQMGSGQDRISFSSTAADFRYCARCIKN